MASRRTSTIMELLVVVALVVAIVLGSVSGLFGSVGRKALYATGLWVDGGSSTFDPSVLDEHDAAARPLPAAPTRPVLAAAGRESGTRAQTVADRVRAVGPRGGQWWGHVVDASTGDTLFANNEAGDGVPASTNKVLTCLSALEVYGPDHRFATTVVTDPAQPGTVYVVGGGDPYLAKDDAPRYPARASILQLAGQAVEALKEQGITGPVKVVADSSYFSGPGWNNDWLPGYRDYATETSALWIGEGQTVGPIGPRDPQPALSAAKAFGDELRRLGVPTGEVAPGTAPQGATQVARVESMPLENIVEQVLIHSDNDAAEVLFRHVGRDGGRSGSIADAQTAHREVLQKLGVWTDGMRIVDGSGLSRANLVSPRSLTKAVLIAVAPDNQRERSIATGMSVAGVEGTLASRFVEDGTEPGRGLVRAKTGTLTEVHSLAGYVRDADGALLVYSFIVNGDKDEYETRVWLDRVTSTLAGCGCR
ncbi:D-alanyl-D-alanine carboxypeptidase/D-alanyl-D-alanine endopeptidase [Mariniluteicoccus endophyticus]